jgi:hypothetical protein
MYQDYKDLLSAFQSHGVKYLIVGGLAVIYHAQPRFTRDMDVFIKADPENATAAYDALAQFGTAMHGMRRKTLPTPTTSFALGATREASIFFRPFPASILTGHGKGALKP